MNRINERNYDACIAVLNDAFDNFDFEKVKRVMDAVDWKWSDLNEADGSKVTRVPTLHVVVFVLKRTSLLMMIRGST